VESRARCGFSDHPPVGDRKSATVGVVSAVSSRKDKKIKKISKIFKKVQENA
jgi:hypothetical protein